MIRSLGGLLTAAAVTTLIFASSASAFSARGSVEQVYATGLPAGAQVSLLNPAGQVGRPRTPTTSAARCSATSRRAPATACASTSSGETSDPLTVLTTQSAPPSTDVYDQTIPSDGYGYLTTRDGTKLAYSVHPPTDITNVEGIDPPANPAGDNVPLPTLIEYSGYGYANPAGPQSGIAALANAMGYTVVDVNMRGTGCSGGAFDFFEPLQSLDGYDVIETVARQPWVAHGKVGMLGISYGGISQLFTAQTQPPSLAAITPLSVIDQVQTTLYPGGILNTGFALNWAKERVHEALPAGPDSGQPWAYQQIQDGDQTCADNQALHPEAVDLLGKVRANDHYVPEVADPLSPITFVDKINVPTFMACQWTDEQTGGHCPTLAKRMTGTDKKWFTYTNGTHVDSLAPETFNKLFDFLELYVAQEPPILKSRDDRTPARRSIFQAVFGIEGMTLPLDPIQLQPTLGLAKAAFEAQPKVRVLFDNGAGTVERRPAVPGLRALVLELPGPRHEARSWFLAPGGTINDLPGLATAADSFTWDAGARPLTDFTGDTASGAGGLWTALPDYHWTQDPGGSAVAYVTSPLLTDTTVVGAGGVNPGSSPRRRTSTCRRRSARSGRTARRSSCRAAGCARTSASSTPRRARCSSPSSACASPTSRRCRRTSSRS